MKRIVLAACVLWMVGGAHSGGTFVTAQAQRVASRNTRSNASPRHASASANTVNPRLAAKVRRVLDTYHSRPMDTRQESPWSLLHWAIAFGIDSRVRTGSSVGEPMTAIEWLCCNGVSAGQKLIQVNNGELSLPIAPGLQGHHGQFLSMLAQSAVDESHALRVGDLECTVSDLIAQEKRTCESDMELTFKLIGICHYTPSEEVWKNERGESWNVRRLLVEELNQPIDRLTCCCGGTHRLFAWSYAVERRRAEGKPVDGPWATAAARVRAYQKRAFQFQNRDGSFSTMWLERPENAADLTRSLITTGHILEWMAISLPESQLRDAKFQRAVDYAAGVLEKNQQTRWHRGALGHSLHALSIYEQRVLGLRRAND